MSSSARRGRRPLAIVVATTVVAGFGIAGFGIAGAHPALAAEPPASPAAVGSWSAPIEVGDAGAPAAVAAAALPDGRVLYGDASGASRTLTFTGSDVPATAPAPGGGMGGDVVQLADGRQLVVGGADGGAVPTAAPVAEGPVPVDPPAAPLGGGGSAAVFDPSGGDGQGTWAATGPMTSARSHASAVTLPDGKVAVVGGSSAPVGDGVAVPVRSTERFDPATGAWTESPGGLPGKSLPPNARVVLAPGGGVFYTGDGQMSAGSPDEALWAQQGLLDPASGQWRDVGVATPRNAPATAALPMTAPYDSMTILRAGGTLLTTPGSYAAVPTSDLTTITADGKVTNLAGPELTSARWFSQATSLPTGEVLVTSGARNDAGLTPGAGLPVRTAELYDPEAKKFFTLASTDRARTLGNSAVLLPNGQVLVGGSAPSNTVPSVLPGFTAPTTADPSFEIFSPPYLYHGPRPHIDEVQAGLAWGESFAVITGDAPSITKVTLMRLPSPQSVMDSDARTLDLPFAQTGDRSLSVDMPADGAAAPPGYYYLFLNRAVDGDKKHFVPSVARIVRVGAQTDRAQAAEPMGEDTVALRQPPAVGPAPADPAPAEAPAQDAPPAAPVDPGAAPVDPGAAPVDPAAPPVDPEAAPLPVDPAAGEVPAPAPDGVPAPAPDALPVGRLPAAPAGRRGRRCAG